jgi:hypothetical protein
VDSKEAPFYEPEDGWDDPPATLSYASVGEDFQRCWKCGKPIKLDKRSHYCVVCRPLHEKEMNNKRCAKFRELHREEINHDMRDYRKTHHDQIKLNARNYYNRYPERHYQSLKNWREKNPEKVKAQRDRLTKRRRLLKQKRKYHHSHKLVENKRTAEWIKTQKNYQYDYYRNTHEVIVATSCRCCGNIIPYKGIGKIPQKCGLCKTIERSRPKPNWNPKEIDRFIEVEKCRLGLSQQKKWTKPEIMALERRYEDI